MEEGVELDLCGPEGGAWTNGEIVRGKCQSFLGKNFLITEVWGFP